MTIRNSNPNTYTLSDECIAYSTYRREWRVSYKKLTKKIRAQKAKIAELYREGKTTTASNATSILAQMRAQATASMKTLEDRKAEWKALLASGHEWRTLTEALAAAE